MLTKFLFTHFRVSRQFLLFFLTLFAFSPVLRAQQSAIGSSGKSSFTAKLINIEAAANEIFRYNTTLYNGSSKPGIYEMKAELPPGWLITYRVAGSQVTSLSMEPGKTQDISIEIKATARANPNKYKIPIKAVSPSDTLSLNLEAVVKGSYSLELTTPTGRLSDEVTSGSQQEIQLVVKNAGSLPLNDVELSAQLPVNWKSTFEPSKIKELEPGKSVDITATLKVPDKTIAGDYAATFKSTNANSNAQAAFRIVVKTSLLSGWIGILVILMAIGMVYYLIRKYGRR
ncbi:COG1470 family protein [Olivibacter domesticus]|uniref:NPCBM-associated, NEW3 domain of alpha-galactosidase n=1 Tax=Olivibacter domesticus TaxID=407022 RepID=A0A1H7KDD6_OLID1|nr:NEW3 domain-containing protein [Olivibacter domesticus]SEK84819.1 NPCBM-associated, NEW3 domain of alpha-galactosidase [Olivibacter domesticus]